MQQVAIAPLSRLWSESRFCCLACGRSLGCLAATRNHLHRPSCSGNRRSQWQEWNRLVCNAMVDIRKLRLSFHLGQLLTQQGNPDTFTSRDNSRRGLWRMCWRLLLGFVADSPEGKDTCLVFDSGQLKQCCLAHRDPHSTKTSSASFPKPGPWQLSGQSRAERYSICCSLGLRRWWSHPLWRRTLWGFHGL